RARPLPCISTGVVDLDVVLSAGKSPGKAHATEGMTNVQKAMGVSRGRATTQGWRGRTAIRLGGKCHVLAQAYAETRLAADCLQRPLRARFRQQLKAGVLAPRKLGVSGWVQVPVGEGRATHP